MPREIITIPVGQCGNQIAWRFFDLALREHAMHGSPGVYDDGMSTFFANTRDADGAPTSATGKAKAAVLSSNTPLHKLKARAVLVDMEEGVVSQVLRSPIGDLFDRGQLITDVSGAGNNWAHGFCAYGPQYRDDVLEQVRRAVEACESPQSFFMIHSMGGGTGSGVGTYILSQLADAYPEMYRFTSAVFPSIDDDVITSPYNFALAFHQLQEHADCILPLENQALLDVVSSIDKACARKVPVHSLRSTAAPTALLASTLTYVPRPPGRVSRLLYARVAGDDDDAGKDEGEAEEEEKSEALRPREGPSPSPPTSAAASRTTSPLRISRESIPSKEVMNAAVAAAVAVPADREDAILHSLQQAEAALQRALTVAASQPSPSKAHPVPAAASPAPAARPPVSAARGRGRGAATAAGRPTRAVVVTPGLKRVVPPAAPSVGIIPGWWIIAARRPHRDAAKQSPLQPKALGRQSRKGAVSPHRLLLRPLHRQWQLRFGLRLQLQWQSQRLQRPQLLKCVA